MWPVNETLAFDGKAYRVLFYRDKLLSIGLLLMRIKGYRKESILMNAVTGVDEGRIEKNSGPLIHTFKESLGPKIQMHIRKGQKRL